MLGRYGDRKERLRHRREVALIAQPDGDGHVLDVAPSWYPSLVVRQVGLLAG